MFMSRISAWSAVLATIVALISFAWTSYTDRQAILTEAREGALDVELLAALGEETVWSIDDLRAEFARRVVQNDRSQFTRADGDAVSFERTLARLIIHGSVQRLDPETVSLSSYASSVRQDRFTEGMIEQMVSSFSRTGIRYSVFEAAASIQTLDQIIARLSHLQPSLSKAEVEALVDAEIAGGFIIEVLPPVDIPNSVEKTYYAWAGVPPVPNASGP